MNKKFIYFKTKTQFTAKLSSLPSNAIVFIEDTKQIWTHGVFFDTSWDYVTGKPNTFTPSAHTLGSHSDVTLAALANGNILRYDGSKWVNNTLAQAGIATPADITTAIDGIEIGGRNYFVVKDLTPKPYPLVGNDHEYIYNLKPNTTYTIRTWNTKGASFRVNGISVSYSITGDKGYKITTDSSGVLRIGLYTAAGETDQFIDGSAKLKLEKGNKATDWTPAPEDQVSDWNTTDATSFSYIKNKPTTLGGYGITDAIQINSDNWANFRYTSITEVNKDVVEDVSGSLKLDGWYALNIGAGNSYGTRLTINGLIGHDKTQLYFNGANGSIQYRKSWYPNTPWTSLRTIWDSGNLTNLNQLTTRNFSDLQNKPTTLGGYGITDAVTTDTTQTITGVKSFSKNVTAPTFIGSLDGNASSATTATTATYLTRAGVSITTAPATYGLRFDTNIGSSTTGIFPTSNNSNAVITINRHSGNYDSQLGFSSNGDIYYRAFSNVALNTTQAWNKLWHSGNLANGTTAQYIRGDGSLATYKDTTYSAMSVAEGQTGTATSSRTMRADYLKQIIQHYASTGIRAGASGTATNASTTNPYIKVTDGGTYSEQIRLSGSGATSVTSDASGNITISSTNTVYTHPTSDGNKHVPATGTTNNGKVLRAGSTAGSMSWATLAQAGIASHEDLNAKIDANKFQVVAALPAPPVTGVFYFVKE